jgi:hypothetical protein
MPKPRRSADARSAPSDLGLPERATISFEPPIAMIAPADTADKARLLTPSIQEAVQ